jgi:Arc/MetJ family transcription regulator
MGRTNIVIDNNLMAAAMAAAGTKTKRETVELGLQELVAKGKRKRALELLHSLSGSMSWEGDLDAERTDIDDEEPW